MNNIICIASFEKYNKKRTLMQTLTNARSQTNEFVITCASIR